MAADHGIVDQKTAVCGVYTPVCSGVIVMKDHAAVVVSVAVAGFVDLGGLVHTQGYQTVDDCSGIFEFSKIQGNMSAAGTVCQDIAHFQTAKGSALVFLLDRNRFGFVKLFVMVGVARVQS